MLRTGHFRPAFLGLALGALSATAFAAPMTYKLDPNHTYPSFEADHGGTSYWRGKFNSSSGTVTLDKAAQTGMVDVTVDMHSIDFGNDGLSEHAQSADMFDANKYPTAHYTGKLVDWKDGAPTAVDGELTMHGVTKPVNLELKRFVCKAGRGGGETCGADGYAEIDRSDFGVDFGKQFGFDMKVVLRIQVEGSAQ